MTTRASRLHRVLERLGRQRENAVVRVAARGARAFLHGYEGNGVAIANIEHNGEKRALDRLGSELGVVFDVGANVGNWTQTALNAGAREIHDFEISPATAASVTQRFAGDVRVRVNAFGLSSEPGTVSIHHYPDYPALTTITDYPHDAASTVIDVPVRTGDDYVAEHGVDRIDFLKLDVEGAEQYVIAGFRKTFERGAVRVVQFEYGTVSILTKYLLRDFYADLTAHGFSIGRIGPHDVEFKAYALELENFEDSNWLAIHESCRELIDRVR